MLRKHHCTVHTVIICVKWSSNDAGSKWSVLMPFFSGFASFSMQISDDERMSLTTAISDDEIDRSSSPVSTRPINSAASFNCTGAVRKAGFLSVKKWLIRKKHKVRPQQCSSSETWSLKRAYVMLIRKIFSSVIPEA